MRRLARLRPTVRWIQAMPPSFKQQLRQTQRAQGERVKILRNVFSPERTRLVMIRT
jgi:hypothetical protein